MIKKINDYRTVLFTAFCVLTIAGLIGLGTWQLKRLSWKNALVAQITSQTSAEPLTYSPGTPIDWKASQFALIEAKGTLDYPNTLRIHGKFLKSRHGGYVLTPLISKERVLLINRGWVEKDNIAAFIDNEKKKTPDIQTISGIIWPEDQPYSFLPQNRPEEPFFLWVQINQLTNHFAQKYPNKIIEQVVVRNIVAPPPPLESFDTKVKLKNDHLEYAITWFMLAIAISVMLAVYIKKKNK